MIPELAREGFDAALAPCSWILIVPALAVLLMARQESTPTIFGYLSASSVVAWLHLSQRLVPPTPGLLALVLVASVLALAFPIIRRVDLVAIGGGALTGAVCGLLWAPCGGPQLVVLTSELPTRGLDGFGFLSVFLLGLFTPIITLATATHLLPRSIFVPVRPAMLVVGATILIILAITVAAGRADELVAWMVARTAAT